MADTPMNEQTTLKAFLVTLFVIAVMALSQAAFAAYVATPTVSGLAQNSAGWSFASPAGSYSMNAANDGFVKPAVVNVGGKAVTMPASMKMAANAGQFAKNAMKLNPLGIAGTLAAGYLLSEGLEWLNNEWLKSTQGYNLDYPFTGPCTINGYMLNAYEGCFDMGLSEGVSTAQSEECIGSGYPDAHYITSYYGNAFNPRHGVCFVGLNTQPNTNQNPATPGDWDALPDPLPAVAPELPYAPYMPEGVPVDAPEYAPSSVPVGQPYTKPDGSTAQPMAKISPAGDGQVTIDTYDQPLTDPQGVPIADPQPQDTPDPQIEQKTDCEKFPASIGCAEFGTPAAQEPLTTLEIPLNPDYSAIGGAGACPASVTVAGITWSYQPFCDFASAIRPLIIGFAWLSFAYIVAGTVRT